MLRGQQHQGGCRAAQGKYKPATSATHHHVSKGYTVCYIWNEAALMRNIHMYTTTGRGWNYKEANSNYKQGKPPVIKLQMRLSMEAMKEPYEIRNCRFVLSQVLWSSTRHICAKKFPRRHTERRGIWVWLHLTEPLTSNWAALTLCTIKQPT